MRQHQLIVSLSVPYFEEIIGCDLQASRERTERFLRRKVTKSGLAQFVVTALQLFCSSDCYSDLQLHLVLLTLIINAMVVWLSELRNVRLSQFSFYASAPD